MKTYGAQSNAQGDVNIEEISNPILVIKNSKNVPPQKIVAILNSPIEGPVATVSALQTAVGAYNTNKVGDKEYFVMSNSVYKNAVSGKEMVATDIPAGSISHDSIAAVTNPVQIYVERVAAKVGVTTTESNKFDTGAYTSGGKKIFAKVEGWEVTNIKNEARLVKKINTAWSGLGFNDWNDAANFRSYWANTETDGTLTHPHTWNAIDMDEARYYYENTGDTKSQLLVKATFVDEDNKTLTGENAVAEWYGAKYTLADLKEQFANAVASEIYILEGTEGSSITKDYITFSQAEISEADGKRHLCRATLAKDLTAGQKFVTPDANEENGYKELTKDEVNAKLAAISPAKIWKEGGYYYLNVRHLGEAEGIVRNHAYQINVNSIDGLGTPVYDPTKIIIPEKPANDQSYIAAQIKVLSWKVVSYGVELE